MRLLFVVTIYLSFYLSISFTAKSQAILIDEMVEAGGLICFPVYGDTLAYRYLPARGRLATADDGLPEFSFLQYATASNQPPEAGQTITEASGGGLIHFMVLYDTPEEKIRKAERELQRKTDRRELVLEGPVNISSGTFTLVSSLLIDGKEEKEVLGRGVAPVFQNSRIAFSFLIDPTKSQILMESFKMATPDISVVFDLKFSGLSQAFNGQLTVDWAQVQNASYSKKSRDAIFYSSDVEESFGEMIQNGAVKLETFGEDSLTGDLLTVAYDRLLNLMFDPVQPDSIPPEDTRGVLGEIFGARGLLGGLVGGSDVYRKQTVKTSGTTSINISSRKMVDRHHLFAFNIGNLWKEYKDNPQIFRKTAIEDPTFKQREVLVNLDGNIREAFSEMINSVSITLKKEHQNGEYTLKELVLNRETLNQYKGTTGFSYLNKDDLDRTKWLDYEYALNWQFKENGGYHTGFQTSNSPIINLYTPYKYHKVELFGDRKRLKEAEILAVSVEIEYPFFGNNKSKRVLIRTDRDDEPVLEALIPREVNTVDYKLTWIYRSGKKTTRESKDEFGVILYDELPEAIGLNDE